MSTPATTERLAGLLAEHLEAWPEEEGMGYQVGWSCECGSETLDPDDVDRGKEWHAAHVATVLAAAGVGFVAEAQAEALRGAADDWQVGGWSNVLLPKPTPPAVPVIAYSNRVLDWLRERADRIGGAS